MWDVFVIKLKESAPISETISLLKLELKVSSVILEPNCEMCQPEMLKIN